MQNNIDWNCCLMHYPNYTYPFMFFGLYASLNTITQDQPWRPEDLYKIVAQETAIKLVTHSLPIGLTTLNPGLLAAILIAQYVILPALVGQIIDTTGYLIRNQDLISNPKKVIDTAKDYAYNCGMYVCRQIFCISSDYIFPYI